MNKWNFIIVMIMAIALLSCSERKETKANSSTTTDTLSTDSTTAIEGDSDTGKTQTVAVSKETKNTNKRVNIYFFHSEHKCATCISIEKVVDEVLKESFTLETKSGIVKLFNINVDDDANNSICEKYEAFGTSLFITGVDGSKEETVDLTAQSFKLARNSKDQLKSILKAEITKKL